jgi:hypothetical protein
MRGKTPAYAYVQPIRCTRQSEPNHSNMSNPMGFQPYIPVICLCRPMPEYEVLTYVAENQYSVGLTQSKV